ncbi:MAG: hypothetical protein ABWW70_01910 [Thermoproteota archaeon]
MEGVKAIVEITNALRSASKTIRGHIVPAENPIENRINTLIARMAETIDILARAVDRLKCVVEAKKVEGAFYTLCRWNIVSQEGLSSVYRVKPATVISTSIEEGKLRFVYEDSKLELSGSEVVVCKQEYCKKARLGERRELARELNTLFYLVRPLYVGALKSLEAITICARNNEPSCAKV